MDTLTVLGVELEPKSQPHYIEGLRGSIGGPDWHPRPNLHVYETRIGDLDILALEDKASTTYAWTLQVTQGESFQLTSYGETLTMAIEAIGKYLTVAIAEAQAHVRQLS